MKPLSRKPRGTMNAIRRQDHEEIGAHFGSIDEWRALGDWNSFTPPEPSRTPTLLDHGYDESKPSSQWSALDYIEAATFRGGELLTSAVEPGTITQVLGWRCAFNHVFAASPRAVLIAGHWCPDCVREPASYSRQAERSPFLAQVELAPRSAGLQLGAS
jgi:hypothetical protein